MDIRIVRRNGTVIIHLKGSLDASSACEVDHALQRELARAEAGHLIVDLANVSYFEYFGIATFARVIRDRIVPLDRIILTGLSSATANVFKSFGIEDNSVAQDQQGEQDATGKCPATLQAAWRQTY
ncbi:MAG: STAS domain-containing protein [Deltaproteobacteria bacterium]|nr:STAS domain-containing protein [Deltaproteobacteria bacterium]MBW2071925.1 STAS domain-containing protein [Deltaproteobacteria bacterium]